MYEGDVQGFFNSGFLNSILSAWPAPGL